MSQCPRCKRDRYTRFHRIKCRGEKLGPAVAWNGYSGETPPLKVHKLELQTKELAGNQVVMAIGDLHAPFMHNDAVDFLAEVKKDVRPTTIVLMGDELDFHALSRWPTDPDGYSAGHESDAGVEQLQDIYKLFPKAHVCISNHTIRPYKRAYLSGLPQRFLQSYRDALEAPPKWEWEERFIIDGVIYEHGEPHFGMNAARLAAMANMRSTVIGHVHAWAGISYYATQDHLIFGANAGCLIDAESYAMAYARKYKSKPVLGVMIVDHGIPRFIPMRLDRKNRWTGKF